MPLKRTNLKGIRWVNRIIKNTKMIKISTPFVLSFILFVVIVGCESTAKVKISCKKRDNTIEFLIQNSSDERIYVSDNIECNNWGDSVVIQPSVLRPRDDMYGRIRYYAFVPPTFKSINRNESLTITINTDVGDGCDIGFVDNLYFRIYSSDFTWILSKKELSHELSYFTFEKAHSKLYHVSR